MDSEDEGDVLSSALSTSMSAFSDGELQSAEVLAVAVEEDSDDELWEQLGSVSSGNINTIPEGEDPVLTKQELIRQIHLRRHVNQLKRNLADKEARVEELRWLL